MEQPTFLKRVSERMWKCAGLFAESKQNHCLARATYPGRPNVQIQAYLCAIVQNLKRLLFSSYSWLVAAGLRFMHREARRKSTNSTPANSTHRTTTESILIQHARSFSRTDHSVPDDIWRDCTSGRLCVLLTMDKVFGQ